MAIAPQTEYPAQTITTDAAYPHGKARNELVPGDGVGTPLEATWLNDLWGFLQALLGAASLAPSGVPDEVGASQYLDAIIAVGNAATTTVWKRLSLSSGQPQTAAGFAKWEWVLVAGAYKWRSRDTAAQPLSFPVNPYVADVTDTSALTVPLLGILINAFTVQMEPGDARAGTSRMLIQLVQSKLVASVLTETVIASGYGSTVTGLDSLTVNIAPAHAFDPVADYSIRVISGDDADTNQDLVDMVKIQYTPTKLPL